MLSSDEGQAFGQGWWRYGFSREVKYLDKICMPNAIEMTRYPNYCPALFYTILEGSECAG
jgi:hypothetical protein